MAGYESEPGLNIPAAGASHLTSKKERKLQKVNFLRFRSFFLVIPPGFKPGTLTSVV